MKSKILHIAECGVGVDRYLKLLLPLLRDSFDQYFICSKNYNPKEYTGIVKETYLVDMGRTIFSWRVLNTVKAIRKIILEVNPDIVYTHSSFGGALGRLACIGLKCKVVYNPHGWSFNIPYGIKPIVYAFLEKILAAITDQIIAISDFEKRNAIKKHVAKSEKISVIYSGIDLNEAERLSIDNSISRSILNIDRNAFLVGISARICETKAPDIFVESASIVKKCIPSAHFMFIGDGELRSGIEGLIRENGLEESFTITGWVDNPMPYIRLLDVGMLLSRWEGFGFALVEYMKLGVPVVATNVCAIPDLIKNEENGLLVPMDDAEAAAKAIIRLYDNSALRDQIIQNGLEIASCRFDSKRMGQEHIELFNALLMDK